MTARTKGTTWLLAIAALASVSVLWLRTAESQTVQTQRVMQQKLAESQQLLGALATSNWTALEERSRALQSLTHQPGWQVLQTPEFRNYTADFQKATQAVADAAMLRDQRTAVTAYNQLVTSCVECHRYVARARIASAPSLR